MNTPIHNLHPVTKLFFTLCGLALGMTLVYIPLMLVVVPLCLLTWPIAKMDRRYYRSMISISLGFLAFFVVIQGLFAGFNKTVLIPMDFPPLIPFIGSAFTTMFGYEGLIYGVCMWLRFFLIFAFIPLLFVTTSLLDMMEGLMQIKLKFQYAFLVATTVRFLPVFMSIQEQIKDAQRIRGMEYDEDVSLRQRIINVISLFVPLTIRGFRFAMDLDVAMRSRAMGSTQTRTTISSMPITRRDKTIMGIVALGTLLVILANSILSVSPTQGIVMLPPFIDDPLKAAAITLFSEYVNPFFRLVASWLALPINLSLAVLGLPTLESVNPYYLYNPAFLLHLPADPLVFVLYLLFLLVITQSITKRVLKYYRGLKRKHLRKQKIAEYEAAEQAANQAVDAQAARQAQ